MGVGPMNLVITNDALYQLSYTSAASDIIATRRKNCKLFFQEKQTFQQTGLPGFTGVVGLRGAPIAGRRSSILAYPLT